MPGHLAVLGGGRMIGPPLLRAAVAEGWQVSVLNRQTPPPADLDGVTHVAGDRGDASVLGELAALAPDVVIDLSCYEPAHLELSLRLLAPRASRYLMMSSGAVYAPGDLLPWDESQPLGGDPVWGSYGERKVRNEAIAAAFAAEVPIVSLRAPYLVGQPDFMNRLQFIADRIAHDGQLFVTDTGNAQIQLVSPADVAACLLHLAGPGVSLGSGGVVALNIGNARWSSLRGLVRLLATAMDRPEPEVVPIALSDVGLPAEPFSWTDMIFPFADRTYLLDDAKLRATGFAPRHDLVTLLEAFVAGYADAGGPRPPTRFPAELAARSRRSIRRGA
jgi:2'-hydroxyisoflavone reductase